MNNRNNILNKIDKKVIVNKEKVEKEKKSIRTIAKWILHQCTDPLEEIEWLLTLLYSTDTTVRGIIGIDEAYSDVLEWLAEQDCCESHS